MNGRKAIVVIFESLCTQTKQCIFYFDLPLEQKTCKCSWTFFEIGFKQTTKIHILIIRHTNTHTTVHTIIIIIIMRQLQRFIKKYKMSCKKKLKLCS